MTDLLLVSIRFALFANLMLIAGLAAFPLYALTPGEQRDCETGRLLHRPQLWLCLFALLLSFGGMAALTAAMQGVGALAIDRGMFLAMVRETDVGAAWLVRSAALLVAVAAALWLDRSPTLAAAILFAAGSAALATLAWAGHAAATDGALGWLHRANDALHMIAAAIWLGAIAAFLLLLRPGAPWSEARLAVAARSLDQFARIGTLCVLVIAATGLVNSQIVIGAANIARSAASPYGQLLAAKLLLFAAMLVIAAANRWRLTPALRQGAATPDQALTAMHTSLMLEAAAGLAILGLVAWFGMLDPFATG
ncbi:copper homeostasis membrane protein CopD [Sphingopyxis sp. L1A2A]|uniref:copper homeostasis membrane protein CopD n=1 Tax=Sphingopyxis sp. L1A2A TaxID=2502247 RepID=UPI0010F7E8B8|nr:copper homeostasis membrane protein CopD [Sphingopyxis sp. L1A2A]